MSGVMTKVAIYGLIEIVFDLAGPPAWWWSAVVLVLGGATAVLGVLYALMQHDRQRLLAYHTVENIGIIVIGLGLALAFDANGMGLPAALALTAALFHVLNHSLFKSLLFFGAGAVQTATGERDMEHLGGLIHRMPTTAVTFLLGCAAISALPPSERLRLRMADLPGDSTRSGNSAMGLKFADPRRRRRPRPVGSAGRRFVKAFGITFLGRPRSAAARSAAEVDAFCRGTMIALVTLCILAGIYQDSSSTRWLLWWRS